MSERGWLQAGRSEAGIDRMLQALHTVRRGEQLPQVSWRKRRLFACACARRVWPLLADDRGRRAIEVSERYADQLANQEELRVAHIQARTAAGLAEQGTFPCENDPEAAMRDGPGLTATQAAARAAALAAGHPINAAAVARWSVYALLLAARQSQSPSAPLSPPSFFERVAERVRRYMAETDAAGQRSREEQAAQCRLLACVCGNPFRPPQVDRSWLSWDGGTVVRLAWAAYDERALPGGTLDAGHVGVLADALEDAGCADVTILTHLRSTSSHGRGCWVIDLVLGKS